MTGTNGTSNLTPDGEYQHVALIVGGASGIGRSTARLYSKHHHKVMIADRSIELGNQVVADLRANGEEADFVQLDIANEESVKNCIDKTVATFGRIDSAVNCAGIGGATALAHELTTAQWRLIQDINLDGAFWFTKYMVAYWLTQPRRLVRDDTEYGLGEVTQRGALLNICSTNALVASKTMMAYGASKHGVAGLTKGFCYELAMEGIRINMVNPGCTLTPIMIVPGFNFENVKDLFMKQQAVKRFAHPDEIANGLYFLNSDEATFCTGTEMRMDGGWTAH